MTYREFADKYKDILLYFDESMDGMLDTKMVILSNLSDIQLLIKGGFADNKLVDLKIDSLKEFVSDFFSVIKNKYKSVNSEAGFQNSESGDGLSGFRG